MKGWINQLKIRMDELNISQEILAQRMGKTRGAINHYLSGRRVPPLKDFHKMAEVLKVDAAWLQYGVTASSPSKNSEKNIITPEYYSIPIYSWEQIPKLTKINKKEIKEVVPNFYSIKPHWYSLRVRDDDMFSATGNSQSFREGDLLIIDPDKEVKHKSFVIAVLPRSKEATFKQYIVDNGIKYLRTLNSQYPITKLEKGSVIYGVVVNCITSI